MMAFWICTGKWIFKNSLNLGLFDAYNKKLVNLKACYLNASKAHRSK